MQEFRENGFVKIEGAFPRELADAGREILWRDTGFDPDDRTTWTKPVVRLGNYAQEPFRRAANTPVLHKAFDELVGPGRWLPPGGLGTFPVRFPHPDDPGDDGWHAEASYSESGQLRLNHRSKGRALLMLFLFSDVGEDDAPTRIRVGSHLDVPEVLEPYGEEGAEFFSVSPDIEKATAHRPVACATGRAGDVYLCHPFLVHAAQSHRGDTPKFMAQPPLLPKDDSGYNFGQSG
ncbi:phytanoyl-CoA dioxygenase family protein [Allokutzneria albata]|uniref:Phytanoyl-CoA dioxygenase (PhyH) n=1 Tax=Allokutzneria albata TaxID=211114 RepID=A0A1H0DBI5_ALLAB|nr:phytanoyl-CoA dioxygenase family protein [Allokutzneria albata]SDN67513.1 Phytanoyl-CoA dioxygenase (PhyH) [Allokutzneria albata]